MWFLFVTFISDSNICLLSIGIITDILLFPAFSCFFLLLTCPLKSEVSFTALSAFAKFGCFSFQWTFRKAYFMIYFIILNFYIDNWLRFPKELTIFISSIGHQFIKHFIFYEKNSNSLKIKKNVRVNNA